MKASVLILRERYRDGREEPDLTLFQTLVTQWLTEELKRGEEKIDSRSE